MENTKVTQNIKHYLWKKLIPENVTNLDWTFIGEYKNDLVNDFLLEQKAGYMRKGGGI